jgi:glycerol uptake facilitator-like aquaporin
MTATRKLTAEALGTLILVGTVVGSGIMAERLTDDVALALLGNTIATGAILVVIILMFGPLSGAHFNPAVTFGFWLRRDIGIRLALAYMAAQITGGLLGMLLAHLMFGEALVQFSQHGRASAGEWLGEAVATFALMAAILGTLRARPEAVPYAVGLVITAGYWWTSSTSFANPAVTIARSLTDTFSGIQPAHAPAFILMQFGGAALAVLVMGWLLGAPRRSAQLRSLPHSDM